MKEITLALSLAISTVVLPANAQMTVCQGDICTEEINGQTRTLTDAEVAKMKRENARTAIGNVECRHAISPDECENLLRSLFSQFPY